MSIEREYRDLDFSRFSKIKESLRTKLHDIRCQAPTHRDSRKLSLEDLDYVAAAGTPMPPRDRNSLTEKPEIKV